MRTHLATLVLASVMFFSLGALAGHTLADSPTPLPACESEDAAGPCVWDATKEGNGVGRSFAVVDGEITYLP